MTTQPKPVLLGTCLLIAAGVITALPLHAQTTVQPPPPEANRPAPAPVVPAASAEDEEEAIVLSPFEVTTERDQGYAAASTLAGTRLRTSLQDTAASISVINKDFLSDIGAFNLDQALVYTVGTEVAGLGGNFSGFTNSGGLFLDGYASLRQPTTSNRVRGLAGADLTRDYFLSEVTSDSYIVDRYDVNRGANSILFGLGSPGGVANSSLIKAETNRTKTKVDLKYGEHGTYRASLDHNQVLIKDRLAIRVAGLRSETKFQQEPAYIEDNRYFLTVTGRPWKGATIRANTEWSRQRSNKMQTTTPLDSYTIWYQLGQPVYNPTTGLVSYLGTEPTDPALRTRNANGTPNGNFFQQWSEAPTLIQQDASSSVLGVSGYPSVVQGFEGTNTRVRSNGTVLVNEGMRRITPSRFFYQLRSQASNPEQFNFWQDQRLLDPNIFNFYDSMIDGHKREFADWETINITFEQQFGRHAGIELAYYREYLDNGYVFPYDFRDYRFNIDVNTHLLNGQPNPNFLRPFAAANGRIANFDKDREAWRATAYYELDFDKDDKNWLTRLLGRHVFTANVTRQTRAEDVVSGPRYITGLDYYNSENANEARQINYNNQSRVLQFVTYTGPSALGTTSPQQNLQGVSATNDPTGGTFGLLYYQAPATNALPGPGFQNSTFTYIAPGKYNFRATTSDTATRTRAEIDSAVLVANSYWWDGVFVSTAGWRRDDFETFDAGNAAFDPATGARILDESVFFPRSTLKDSSDSLSYAGVLHVSRPIKKHMPLGSTLSLTYNKSDNFTPSAQRFDNFNQPIDAPKGETEEYGIIASILNRKIELRAARYETTAGVATNNAFTEIQNTLIRRIDSQIELNSQANYNTKINTEGLGNSLAAWQAWQQTAVAQQLFATHNFTFLPQSNGTTIVNSDNRVGIVVNTSDVVAKGYEFDVTLNPTKQWRMTVNVAKQEAVRSNTAESFQALIAQLDPVFTGPAGLLPDTDAPGTGGANLLNTWNTVKASAQREILLDGSASPEIREWRVNFVTNYTIGSGTFKNVRLGGSIRWQDKAAIGYPVIALSPGVGQYDVTRPYYGPDETNYDAWIGYSRKLNKKLNWNIQLNVRNIGVGNKLIPVGTQPDGSISTARIAEPQTWLVSNTFEF